MMFRGVGDGYYMPETGLSMPWRQVIACQRQISGSPRGLTFNPHNTIEIGVAF